MYTPILFDFSLNTYDPKGFKLAKKQCGDQLSLEIDPWTKRYGENFGRRCTFYGEKLNKKIYNIYMLNKLIMAANHGDAKDQYALAEAYYYEWYSSMENNKKEALKWYQKASDQGFSDAEYIMAQYYEGGESVPKDFSKAMDLYYRAASHGSEGAQIILAEKYFFGEELPFGTAIIKDDVQAAKWYEKAAEQGDRNSSYMIGMMYQNGYGVPKDYKKAILWYNRGIERGSREAGFSLGMMYKDGEGVSKNTTKARKYLKDACKDLMQEACQVYKKLKR